MSEKPDTTPNAKSSKMKFAVLAIALLLVGGGTWFVKSKGYFASLNSDNSPESAVVVARKVPAHTPESKPGHTHGNTPASTQANTMLPAGPAVSVGHAPQEPKDTNGCFEVTYQHAKIATHNDGELCAEHKNRITLDIKNLNTKSVCMRVNGNPVHAQVFAKKGEPTVVLFDSVAGPKSVVTARYCTGPVACGMDCKVSKDEFLDALGGADDTFMTGGVGAAAWDTTKKDGKATKTEVELEKELKDFRGEFAEKGEGQEKFFAGWQETGRSEACEGRRVASVGGTKSHTRKQ